MPDAQLRRIEDSLQAIQTDGPGIPRVKSLLSACGFRQTRNDPPYQRTASDNSAVLAFPEHEKPIAFFPFEGKRLDWSTEVYPCLEKCWDWDWTGIQGATGRAFLVTKTALWAYVLPVRPDPQKPVKPVEQLRFGEAQKWSRELLLLTSDTIHAASYWDFLSTPTAELRRAANDSLVARFDGWSNDLAKALAKKHKDISREQADHLIRAFLDQLLFVRFCEDRRVTNLERTLFDYRSGQLDWRGLRSLMREYERILNGDIFDPVIFAGEVAPAGLLQEVLLCLYQDFTLETIPSGILGRTYERSLARQLKWSPPSAAYVESDELRKEYGIYYTPETVASYLAERALKIWTSRATKPLDQVQFLDPCAGSGTFLVQALRALTDVLRRLRGADGAGVSIDERAHLLEHCIFGMDIERAPLERSSLACYFEALSGQGVAAGERLLPRLLGKNLWEGDARSLADSLPKKFQADIVLLNPPYTDHRKASAACWEILRQATDHLPENGVLGAIVPDALLRNERLSALRKHILDLTAIEEFGLVRTRIFAEPNIRPILILLRKVEAAHTRMAHRPTSVFIRSIEPRLVPKRIPRTQTQAHLMEPALYSFNVHVPDSVIKLQSRLLESGRFKILRGFFRDCSCGIMNAPAISLRKLSKASGKLPAGMRIFVRGKDIGPFHAIWGNWVIDYQATRTAKKETGSHVRAREPEFFDVPCKLLVRRSGSILRACLDFEGRYMDDKAIIFLPDPQSCNSALLHFILGYLNSEIGWLWCRMSNPQDLSLMPQLRQHELEDLWIPIKVDQTEMTHIAVLSHRIAQTLASGYLRLDNPTIVQMRQQLLVRLARLLELSENDVNTILDFLDEPNSICERPFAYPRRVPSVPVIELPARPDPSGHGQDLLSTAPLSSKEQMEKDDWEDVINGPLPDIYEHQPVEDQLRLGTELRTFAERLERIEALLQEGGE